MQQRPRVRPDAFAPPRRAGRPGDSFRARMTLVAACSRPLTCTVVVTQRLPVHDLHPRVRMESAIIPSSARSSVGSRLPRLFADDKPRCGRAGQPVGTDGALVFVIGSRTLGLGSPCCSHRRSPSDAAAWHRTLLLCSRLR